MSNMLFYWMNFTQFNISNVYLFQERISALTAARNVRYYWIGLNRMFGRWVWTDGTPALYTNWRPGEPDGCCGANTTCALVNYGNTLGQWDDAGCETLWANPQGFVCKKAVWLCRWTLVTKSLYAVLLIIKIYIKSLNLRWSQRIYAVEHFSANDC